MVNLVEPQNQNETEMMILGDVSDKKYAEGKRNEYNTSCKQATATSTEKLKLKENNKPKALAEK